MKWLGRFSLLNAKLSTFIFVKALKSSGMSITGMEMWLNSRTVWLIPHMKTDSKGSEARYSFLFGCFTLICLVFMLELVQAAMAILKGLARTAVHLAPTRGQKRLKDQRPLKKRPLQVQQLSIRVFNCKKAHCDCVYRLSSLTAFESCHEF